MAGKLQNGSNVEWSFGAGKGNGSVAEVKTSGQLEIESKGKLVHRNADPSNPAVHVEREGNDVVKRASELTKLDSYNEDEDEDANQATDTVEPPQEAAGADSGATTEPAPKKRAPRKTTKATASAGEKRERGDEDPTGPATGGEQDTSEAQNGKKAKKSKTSESAVEAGDADNVTQATKGAKKTPGRPRKGSKRGQAQEHVESKATEGDVAVEATEDTSAAAATPKKKGPGRPKKSDDSDHPPIAVAEFGEDVPAARTRSKDD